MIREALSHLDPHDRDLWVTMAMAVKNAEGESGFHDWDQWSRGAENYRERDALAVWRSVKPLGGITVATLYKLAREAGYRGEEREYPHRNHDAELKALREAEEARREQARQRAMAMIEKAQRGTHEYLIRKGFPHAQGFILDNELLIPMWEVGRYAKQLNTLQRIQPDGTKLFLPGGKAKGSVFILGSGSETILCEGYATALSIKAATEALYMRARVIACFSAHNLTWVAKLQRGRAFIIADHDQSGAGQSAAAAAGLPYWMPPDVGTDANDYHMARGVRSLAAAINTLRR